MTWELIGKAGLIISGIGMFLFMIGGFMQFWAGK
jgi:hypothetical protein